MQFVQLSEATGWQAVYANKQTDREEAPYVVLPVACWALIEEMWEDDTPATRVVGMVPDGDDLDPAPCKGFLGYLGPGQNIDDYAPLAAEFWREQADSAAESSAKN